MGVKAAMVRIAVVEDSEQEKNIIFILKYIELHYATLTLPELPQSMG